MKHVYIFRGGPASGKGTVVPEFAKTLPLPVALIEQDALRWGFHLIGREISEVTDEEHHLAYRNLLHVYEEYLKSGQYTIVLEGLFTWDDKTSSQGSAKQLVEIAERHGYAAKSIVLTADHDELVRRNAARHYTVPSQEFETLFINIYGHIDASEVQLDSTNLSAEDTLVALRKLL